jgi:hypothetical protein
MPAQRPCSRQDPIYKFTAKYKAIHACGRPCGRAMHRPDGSSNAYCICLGKPGTSSFRGCPTNPCVLQVWEPADKIRRRSPIPAGLRNRGLVASDSWDCARRKQYCSILHGRRSKAGVDKQMGRGKSGDFRQTGLDCTP